MPDFCYGCTDVEACNYNENSVVDDGSCEFVIDCLGVCGGNVFYDACDVCGGNNSTCTGCTDLNACNYDSQATIADIDLCIYPEFNFDCNGICLVEVDCNGICGGDAVLDECEICNGSGLPCDECPDDLFLDCNGVCGGAAQIDNCGVCDGDNSTCTGCMDLSACNFDEQATISDNSLCTYAEENYDCYGNCIAEIDCNGICGGNAIVDSCGVCNGNGSTCADNNCEEFNLVDCNQAWQCEWDDGECEDKDCDEFNQIECDLIEDCQWDEDECDDIDDGSGSGSGSGLNPDIPKTYNENPKLF